MPYTAHNQTAGSPLFARLVSWSAGSLLLVAFMFVGCTEEADPHEKPIASPWGGNGGMETPTAATDVVDHGEGWQSFRLNVGGKNRHFLRHVSWLLGSRDSRTETLVELGD